MSKPISRQVHGILDYSAAPLVAAAPALIGFSDNKNASLLSYVLGGGILALTASTRAEWGLVKSVPFKTHLTLDVVTALTSLSAPWLLGFSKNKKARNTFLAIGATLLATGLLTEKQEMPKYRELGE
ncbi:hypothetical protein ACFST9_01420 [Hymenobacter monticola]|uniref:SPW repeat-containing integral membrane domain-containing protein n=1 Tax=Hymenobacter monticola TaxID=1705399 RepID=A0ABY4B2K7_9BACT|nr:hypothetical protein [Hymenobacter monticola]UOE33379.1 hypothetical protein MTP16_19910 [Hymenobacter monticola]